MKKTINLILIFSNLIFHEESNWLRLPILDWTIIKPWSQTKQIFNFLLSKMASDIDWEFILCLDKNNIIYVCLVHHANNSITWPKIIGKNGKENKGKDARSFIFTYLTWGLASFVMVFCNPNPFGEMENK